MRFAAVADPHDGRRERLVKEYGIPRENAFRDWRELLERPQLADAVINALFCRLHFDSGMAVLPRKRPAMKTRSLPWRS